MPKTFEKGRIRETNVTGYYTYREGLSTEKLLLGEGFENWTDKIIDFGLDVMTDKYVAGYSIKKGTFPYFTDFAAGNVATIVGEHVKALIEEIDPGSSQFAPMDLVERPRMLPVWVQSYPWFMRRRCT